LRARLVLFYDMHVVFCVVLHTPGPTPSTPMLKAPLTSGFRAGGGATRDINLGAKGNMSWTRFGVFACLPRATTLSACFFLGFSVCGLWVDLFCYFRCRARCRGRVPVEEWSKQHGGGRSEGHGRVSEGSEFPSFFGRRGAGVHQFINDGRPPEGISPGGSTRTRFRLMENSRMDDARAGNHRRDGPPARMGAEVFAFALTSENGVTYEEKGRSPNLRLQTTTSRPSTAIAAVIQRRAFPDHADPGRGKPTQGAHPAADKHLWVSSDPTNGNRTKLPSAHKDPHFGPISGRPMILMLLLFLWPKGSAGGVILNTTGSSTKWARRRPAAGGAFHDDGK